MKEATAGLRPSLCHGVRCQFGANFWCQFFALMWICSFELRGFSMSRCAFLAAALIVLLPAWPCFAVDAKQKMATCTFGADQQRLQGQARDAFPRNAWRIGTIRAAGRLPEPSPHPSNSAKTIANSALESDGQNSIAVVWESHRASLPAH